MPARQCAGPGTARPSDVEHHGLKQEERDGVRGMSEKNEASPSAAPLAGPASVRMVGLPEAVGLAAVKVESTANANSRISLVPTGVPASLPQPPAPHDPATPQETGPQSRAERGEARIDGQPAPDVVTLRPKLDSQPPKTALDGGRGSKGPG